MRKRIPSGLVSRAEKIIRDSNLQRRRPIMLVPRMLPVDEWDCIASKMQRLLKDNVVKDVAPDYGDLPRLELVAAR
tara:strand:- start:2233 stop:2460 length:228 start_codon:yes stop_codon:yes gene_type:complete